MYIFCCHRDWAKKLFVKLSKKYDMHLITSPKELTLKKVKQINPKFIFFPDWSWIVPSKIIDNYSCICFHESDLPKFRGGSPIQNQIINGIKQSKTSAFLMDDGLDTGDILLKKSLSLDGSINEIFDRMITNDYEMIVDIINKKYTIKKQHRKSTVFKRRKPEESELEHLNHSNLYLYNFVRMLEDPYPNAFIKIGKKKIIFKSMKMKKNILEFRGIIE